MKYLKMNEQVERKFSVKFPTSFVDWHKSHFFFDCDCPFIRLPGSRPNHPLEEVVKGLDWNVAEKRMQQKLYPFASDGNDIGPFVFDARNPVKDNEFPIRAYDHEFMGALNGLSEIIFSSFSKLLECMTHYMMEIKVRPNLKIIPDFSKLIRLGLEKKESIIGRCRQAYKQ